MHSCSRRQTELRPGLARGNRLSGNMTDEPRWCVPSMRETHYLEGSGWRTGVLVDMAPSPATAPMLMPTHGEYPIYDSPLYEAMATDTERNWRFREALDRY